MGKKKDDTLIYDDEQRELNDNFKELSKVCFDILLSGGELTSQQFYFFTNYIIINGFGSPTFAIEFNNKGLKNS